MPEMTRFRNFCTVDLADDETTNGLSIDVTAGPRQGPAVVAVIVGADYPTAPVSLVYGTVFHLPFFCVSRS